MTATPPPEVPAVLVPRERLLLPGPRAGWWLLAALTIAAPLAAHLNQSPLPTPDDPAGLRAELRGRTFLWRILMNSAPEPEKVRATARSPADAALEADLRGADDRDWNELVRRATALDAGSERSEQTPRAGPALRAELTVHALALGQPERAVALAQQVTALDEDVRALLTGLPAAPTACVLPAAAARDRLHDPRFGRGWSPYQRDLARLAALSRLEDLGAARALNLSLRQRDRWVVPAWSSVALLFLVAIVLGLGFWLSVALRGAAAHDRGRTAWAFVRSRYPGLPRDLPYPTDPLLPWLGFGGWLTAYLLASLWLAAAAGQRAMSGLGVLFEAGVGALAAIAVVQAFARRAPGVVWAARLRLGDGDATHIRPGIAFLAAIRVLTALLPAMLLVVLLLALLGVVSAAHPVAGMVLQDADPLQLTAIGLAVTLLAPLGEELIFRGFLYRALRMRWPVLPALIVVSLAFSTLHPALGPYLVLSAAFCLAYEWTGSLWTSILLHALWNGLSYALLVGVALS